MEFDLLIKNGAVLECKTSYGGTLYDSIPTNELLKFINENLYGL